MLHLMWESNPHGAGFMYPSRNADGQATLKTVKGLMSFNALKRELQKRRDEYTTDDHKAKVDIAIHFRIASAGGQAPRLTHPFHAGDDVGLMHNGHIASLAYDSNDFKNLKPDTPDLPGASHAPSATESQTMAVFKDEKTEELAAAKLCLDELVRAGEITEEQGKSLYIEYRKRHVRPKKHKPTDSALPPVPPAESDTSRLAQILGRLPRGWQRNDVCHFLIKEEFLGSDRVVLFDAKGLAAIIGETWGTSFNGVWYSNDYWIPRKGTTGPTIVSGKDMVKDATATNTKTTETKSDGYYPPYRHSGYGGYAGSLYDGDDSAWTPSHRRPHLGCTVGTGGATGEASGASGNTAGTAGGVDQASADSAGARSLPPGVSSEADDVVTRELPDDLPALDDTAAWDVLEERWTKHWFGRNDEHGVGP